MSEKQRGSQQDYDNPLYLREGRMNSAYANCEVTTIPPLDYGNNGSRIIATPPYPPGNYGAGEHELTGKSSGSNSRQYSAAGVYGAETGPWSTTNSAHPMHNNGYGVGYPPGIPINTNPPPYYAKYLSGEGISDEPVVDFTNKSIRQGFVKKVFSILLLQLALTFGIIGLFVLQPDIKAWMMDHNAPWFIMGSTIGVIVLTIFTYCSEWARRKSPQNLVVLSLLTLSYALLAASIAVYFSVNVVLYAAGTTLSICLLLTLFSLQSKWELTILTGVIISLLTLVVVGGVLALLINYGVIERIRVSRLIFAFIAVMILSVFLVYDIKRITKGQHRFAISPEEYVHGAVAVYVDVIIIFILILVIFGVGEKGGDCANGGGHHGGGGIWFCWGWGTANDSRAEEERRRRENGDYA